MENLFEKAKAVILGHAVADALGVPVEFCSREELDVNPVTSMREYGTYNMPKGSWSDDTSMSLCALEVMDKKLNFHNVMLNFCKWYYKGEFTPTGKTFDVGRTSATAIERYYLEPNREVFGVNSERANGNGALMRIHPFSLYAYKSNLSLSGKLEVIEIATTLTHAHKRSILASKIYSFVLWELLNNPSKESVKIGLVKAKNHLKNQPELVHYNAIFEPDLLNTKREEIKSTGYVVDSLIASLWCLLTTDSYKDCVLKAVNLGDDTDTIGAIAGGLAGGLYGLKSIPKEWLDSLLKKDYIESLIEKAFSF
ncbi:MAG: ADP-ribosylglycohydrolase [Clostridiales bacterium]|nr:ADP-ribosylglycohydrolase [Clostridiales bacterium]